MAKGVFIYRPDSKYDDVPSVSYQFPDQYLSRAKQMEGDWVIYLEPRRVPDTQGYFAVAKIQEIIPDRLAAGMHKAIVQGNTFRPFGTPVPFRGPDGVVERSVLNQQGNISGRGQAAVRVIPTEDFDRIIGLGMASTSSILPRVGDGSDAQGLFEPERLPYFANERERSEFLRSAIVRDRNFRRIVLTAYEERCAITGLQLINGGGRAEVEAAHIQPVEMNGPDILTNGIALCGTAHWMFDRGLISLGDDLKILFSRQVNDPESIHSIINKTGYLLGPRRDVDRPHPRFLHWHREHQFKH